jgi:hypothetical protein
MTIHATQRQRNIEGSIEKYIATYLVGVDGVKVQFPTVPFNSDGLSEWAAVHYLAVDPRQNFRRALTSGEGATDSLLLMQMSCFARTSTPSTGAQASRWALATLVDKVQGRFALKREINVYDYATSPTTTTVVGTLLVVNTELARVDTSSVVTGEQGVRSPQGLGATALTVTLQWTKIHGHT